MMPTPNPDLSPVPKFQGAASSPGPTGVADWVAFIRWLRSLWQKAKDSIDVPQSITFGQQESISGSAAAQEAQGAALAFKNSTLSGNFAVSRETEAASAFNAFRDLHSRRSADVLPYSAPSLQRVPDDALSILAFCRPIIVPRASASPLTTKGDVWGFDSANNRVPVGANGTVLTADSTQALGVKYAVPYAGVTQQSIANPWFGTPVTSRALATVYQNLTGKPLKLNVVVALDAAALGSIAGIFTDASPTPTTEVTFVENLSSILNGAAPVTWEILPNYYYKVALSQGTGSLLLWGEEI